MVVEVGAVFEVADYTWNHLSFHWIYHHQNNFHRELDLQTNERQLEFMSQFFHLHNVFDNKVKLKNPAFYISSIKFYLYLSFES